MRKSLVVAAALLFPFGVFADDGPKPTPATGTPAPGAPATAPPAPAPPPPSDPATAGQTNANGSYTVRLHDLERRVN